MAKTGFIVEVKKDLDMRKFEALLANAKASARKIGVGYPDDGKAEADGTSVAMVAAVHNFGAKIKRGEKTTVIPERPFLEPAITRNRQQFIALNRVNVLKVLQGKMKIEQALGQLGAMAVGAVQREIKVGEYKELAVSTIKAKGSSKPLIDTAQMMQSTTFILDPKSKT